MSVTKNVNKLYIIVFFHNLIPAYVIERLFWEERGMTVLMVVYCEMIYAVSVVLFEIPTGVLADKFGRKALLIVGAALAILEFIILLFAFHFWTFALVVFLAGASKACTSGALNALLYDSLMVVKKQHSFEKIVGRMNSIDFIASIFAGLSGSILAEFYGFEFNYILSALSMLIAFSATILLKEPPLNGGSPNEKKSKLTDYLFESLLLFKGSPKLVIILMHAMTIVACMNYLDEFWQLYLNEIEFLILFFGVFSAIISLARIPGNLIAAYLLSYFKAETIIVAVLGVIAIGFFMTSLFPGVVGIAMIIIIFLASGVVDPVVAGCLHHSGSSDIRATIESIQSMVQRGIILVVGFGFGIVSTQYNVITGFFYLGVVSGVFLLSFIIVISRRKFFAK